MLDKVFTNNQVTIAGEVVSEFTFSHEVSISQYADLAIRMM